MVQGVMWTFLARHFYRAINQPLKAALPAAQLGAGQLSTALPVRQRDGSTYPFRLPELRSITCCALGTKAPELQTSPKSSNNASPTGNVILMDASCFCYQFFHAASRKLSSVGRSTAVEHLFLKRVLDVISGQQILGFGRASQLIVVFDSPPASTGGGQPLRRSMYPEYKANRSKSPDEVLSALNSLPSVLHAMGVNTLLVPGVEADDVIATLTTSYTRMHRNVTVYSSDKDFKQLLCELACLDRMKEVETEETFVAEHHFRPEFFPEFQALTGDAADNVVGVRGIGPKKAKNLISKHLTIENVYMAIPGMASNAVTKSLAGADVAQVLQMRSLFQLQRNVRTKDGEDLLDVLPFGHDNLLDFDRADVDWVVDYMDRLELKQDKAAFLAVMKQGQVQ